MKVSLQARWAALIFALAFPSLVTWAYFVLLANQPAGFQQSVYVVGKTLQFAFPAVWVLLVLKQKVRWSLPQRRGMPTSIGFGLLVAGAMLLLYAALKPAGFFSGPDEMVREKILDLGLNRLWKYASVGIFYALCHSLMEEYYWRWFVFGQMRRLVSFGPAMTISSLGFMAHHIILLAKYFGWDSPSTYIFSLGVAIGGAVWAWIYERTGSLYGPWLSHCLVDATIFILGYDLARTLF
jgi:membrane protease YdiL (CAAX protease family)